MFGIISEDETGTTRSGKGYKIETRKISYGQDPKTFIETNYSPLFSESKSEESLRENPEVTPHYSPF